MKILKSIGEIQKAKFTCKMSNIKEVAKRSEGNFSESYKVVELVIMTDEEYNEFKNNLMADRDWLDGKGGTDSTTKTETHESKHWTKWTEEEMSEFRLGAYRECVGVTTAKANEMIVVDPQGYKYARYAAVVSSR